MNPLDLVYHERLLRIHPEFDRLRTDRTFRAEMLTGLVTMAKDYLQPRERAKYERKVAELMARAGDDDNKAFGTLAMTVPTAALHLAVFRHWDMGSPVYVVGSRLQSMFTRTKLDNVRPEDLRMPYDTLYIALPDCPETIWGGKQRHQVTGLFVQGHMENDSDGTTTHADTDLDALFLIALGEDLSGEEGLGDDAVHTAPVDLHAKEIETACGEYGGIYDGLMPTGDHRVQDEHSMGRLIRIAVNTLLYLSAELPSEETADSLDRRKRREELLEGAKRRKAAKAKKASKKASKISPMSVVWLGQSVEESVSEGGTHESPRQHWVTGHWHAYWHGAGKTQRKMNWVRPFLRGDPKRGQTDVRLHMADEE